MGLAIALGFVADIARGFRANQKVAAHLEKALHCYDADFWGPGIGALYPDDWARAGTVLGKGRFFGWIWMLLPVSFIAASVLVWLHK